MMFVILREAWGAKAPVRPCAEMGVITRITLHRSEGPCPVGNATAPVLRHMQAYHQHPEVYIGGEKMGCGWADIAYHFLIDGDGKVWEGRPLAVQGAHCAKKNRGNIGVCMLGKDHFPPMQTAALADLLSSLCGRFGLQRVAVEGHRNVPPSETDCPGDALAKWLTLWRQS